MNTAVAVTELFVTSREAGSHSWFWHNAEGWRSRKTSRSRPCKWV